MPPDLPRFSLRLHQGLTPQACRALAASAEAHGFHTLWFAENPFGRAILPAVAACAADTSRVRLGLGILNPYQHATNPLLCSMICALNWDRRQRLPDAITSTSGRDGTGTPGRS